MPHILILGTWDTIIDQMHVYTEQIAENIDKGEYHGSQLAEAQALVENVETFWQGVDTSHRAAADGLVADIESFLGI